MALFIDFSPKNDKKKLSLLLKKFSDFPIGNLQSAIGGEKKILFGIGNGDLFRPQIKQKRNTDTNGHHK